MKLNVEHIRYVMDSFKENTTKIRNIRQYMLTIDRQKEQEKGQEKEEKKNFR